MSISSVPNIEKKLLSIDLFDTLVHRLCKYPVDIFYFLQENPIVKEITPNFQEIRIKAEALARHHSFILGNGETLLDEIYQHIKMLIGCTSEQLNILKKLEIETELSLIKLSNFGKKILSDIKKFNIRFVITSDMYLPKEVIYIILERNGINGYEKLFLSSELGRTKHSGELFQDVIEYYNVDPTNILHIGDNKHADINMAREKGLNTYQVFPVLSKLTDKDNKAITSIFKGYTPLSQLFITNYLDSYSYDKTTLELNEQSEEQYFTAFGACVLAPILVGFCIWLNNTAAKNNISNIKFLARDGKIFKEVFNLLFPQTYKTSYIAASRRMSTLPYTLLTSTEIKNFFSTTLTNSKSLKEFYSAIKMNESLSKHMDQLGYKIDMKLTKESRKEFLQALSENSGVVLKSFTNEKNIVSRYYKAEFKDIENNKIGIMDIGWRGSLQRGICNALESKDKIIGFYFATVTESIDILARDQYEYHAYICKDGVPYYNEKMIQKFIDVIEFLISADHGSVNTVDTDFKWIYSKVSDLEKETMQYAKIIQTGALNAIKNMKSLIGLDNLTLLAKINPCVDLWNVLLHPTQYDALKFKNIRVFSGIGDGIGESLTKIGDKGSHYRNIKKSRWPEAYFYQLPRLSRKLVNFRRKKRHLEKIL